MNLIDLPEFENINEEYLKNKDFFEQEYSTLIIENSSRLIKIQENFEDRKEKEDRENIENIFSLTI